MDMKKEAKKNPNDADPLLLLQGGGGGLQQGFSMPVTVPVNPSSVYSDPGNHRADEHDHGNFVIHDEDIGKDDDDTSLLNIFKMTQVQFFRPAHFISSSCVTTAAFTGSDT